MKKKELSQKVLLTGASGFIGSFLAEKLLEKGYQVRGLVRTSDDLRWIADLDIECHFGDLLRPDTLLRAVEDVDYIYHVAGLTKSCSGEDYYKINEQGTKNIINAILKTNQHLKRFIYVSSQAAAGPSPTLEPLAEIDKPKPITDYGKSKLAAEEYLEKVKNEIPLTIVRPSSVYGPRDRDILHFFKTVKKGINPQVGRRQKYLSLIFVRDLIRGIILAAERKKSAGKTYFITSPRPYSWDEIARVTLKLFNKRGVQVYIPETVIRGISAISELYSKITLKAPLLNNQKFKEMKQSFWVCSPKRARNDLGFEAKTSLEEGLRETLDWYLKYGWL